jgi:hypothetical protein
MPRVGKVRSGPPFWIDTSKILVLGKIGDMRLGVASAMAQKRGMGDHEDSPARIPVEGCAMGSRPKRSRGKAKGWMSDPRPGVRAQGGLVGEAAAEVDPGGLLRPRRGCLSAEGDGRARMPAAGC